MAYYFRAFIGAVSLKPQIRALTSATLTYFRAFIGAVSLKQIHPPESGGYPSNFRAFIGAVSLKQFTVAGFGNTVSHFRAFIGAVSLKPGQFSLPARGSTAFPRLHRRGLIEAFYRCVATHVEREISAPSSARSH